MVGHDEDPEMIPNVLDYAKGGLIYSVNDRAKGHGEHDEDPEMFSIYVLYYAEMVWSTLTVAAPNVVEGRDDDPENVSQHLVYKVLSGPTWWTVTQRN